MVQKAKVNALHNFSSALKQKIAELMIDRMDQFSAVTGFDTRALAKVYCRIIDSGLNGCP